MVVDQMVELIERYVRVSSLKPLDQMQIDELFQETFPHYLNLFQNLLTAQNTTFFASNQITWADLVFCAFFDIVGERKNQLLSNYPGLIAIDSTINYLPQIVNWKSIRP